MKGLWQMLTQKNPREVPPFEPQNKLFQGVLKESTQWGDMQGIETAGVEWQDYQRRRITGGTVW